MLRKLLKKYGKSSTEESLPCELCTNIQLIQQPVTLSTPACCSLQSSGNNVVCTGWLGKLTPEKKLAQYAWKKHWFILRSGKMSGDPDILEYYKNEHSKKPLRIINLNFCMQLDVALTFNKKEPQRSFMFDIITNEHTFQLVTDT
ncbi:GRB2-associated-binding protein 2 [Cricetulus griseus]|uniref:GRB2-associated-binding protein 2 n=1 Tax=Cricetulus griseus TaxID=10029 RepID=G3IMB7_CRIGR|nr:GRB2-associated-binding protein 2 [Cricetulus griseus]ERE71834.1 GRB2-associated-binding protein 2 [Cricetulus griseus]